MVTMGIFYSVPRYAYMKTGKWRWKAFHSGVLVDAEKTKPSVLLLVVVRKGIRVLIKFRTQNPLLNCQWGKATV